MESLKVLVIPDTQCKPGVPLDHLDWAGQYIVDKRPDIVVHLGDHWDFPSLSRYDEGKRVMEGRRIDEDIEAGNEGMRRLTAPLQELQAQQRRNKQKLYQPRLILLRGNHEDRLARHIEANSILPEDFGWRDLLDTELGWEVYPFLEVVKIGGTAFSHYFYNPMSGNPWGGMASTMLKNIGFSFVMGHRQGKEMYERHLSDGTVQRALIVGSFYQHDEAYKGPQANHHWRGVVMLHEAHDGDYDLMEVSLGYLQRRYAK